ncbi:MAG: Hpt domain-containing protein, partial [Nannocystaceae bacterium]
MRVAMVMMTTGHDDLQRARAKLGQLRERFGVRLRERLGELATLVEQAHLDPTPGSLAEAGGAAHRLAGTAGSYGFVEVGEAAAALERSLQRIAGGQDEWEA